jgi:hypothetical protein
VEEAREVVAFLELVVVELVEMVQLHLEEPQPLVCKIEAAVVAVVEDSQALVVLLAALA